MNVHRTVCINGLLDRCICISSIDNDLCLVFSHTSDLETAAIMTMMSSVLTWTDSRTTVIPISVVLSLCF